VREPENRDSIFPVFKDRDDILFVDHLWLCLPRLPGEFSTPFSVIHADELSIWKVECGAIPLNTVDQACVLRQGKALTLPIPPTT